MAGSLKRANPDLIEDGVLIRAMRDANIPKFLNEDVPLFNAIIQDLFPSVEIKENDYGKLKDTIEEMTKLKYLQCTVYFIEKVIQLYETFNVRFGVMLVGNSGGGKTRVWETLCKTYCVMREREDANQAF
jgi:dynein heavy chain